jgi:hypothetical protein
LIVFPVLAIYTPYNLNSGDGDVLELGDTEPLGETEALLLRLAEADGLVLELGLRLVLELGLTEPDGLNEALGCIASAASTHVLVAVTVAPSVSGRHSTVNST